MVIIAGISMSAMKVLTIAFTMLFATTPMVVGNANVKQTGFYEQMTPNVDQMYVLTDIMDRECIVSKCPIMLNARKKLFTFRPKE